MPKKISNTNPKSVFKGLAQGVIDIFYPKFCVACKNRIRPKDCSEEFICKSCQGKIRKNLPPFCNICGRRLKKTEFSAHVCSSCPRQPLHFDRAFSPCLYEGVIKTLLHEFKYQKKDYLGSVLSRLMIDFIKEYRLPLEWVNLLVPVPLYKTRLREREFNQSQILSDHIAAALGKPTGNNLLIRHRLTRTQTELESEDRFLNVKDSFSVTDSQKVKGKNILLIDDVMTTGATSSEASAALKKAGAGIVFTLTLAN